ncbi:GntR family transcriptional regulator [Bacillus sp. REN16]|uniref:GntR family transcriptional regulator n=1 Tax=Bacillus sp. REN16 TaxID=2887296 RepID=UPI001E3FE2B8|nr:GntR family transcriptional regulator [Bacillus sp. REN16]MCC3356824.1 GntR family transcriptional regulator [Bacillus sp. REN16]
MQNIHHTKDAFNFSEYKQLADPIKRALQKINRNNPLPLYHQLYDSLYQVIVNKELEPGSFFATESLLQEETQMSRATIRKALGELVREKYLMPITGKGTFISITFPENHIVLPQLKSFSQELRERGMKPGTVELQTKIITPSEQVAKKLGIEVSDQVLFTERIRTGNNIPILYLCSYIPANIGIFDDTEIPESLYELIEDQCGKAISSAKHTISAVIVNTKISKHLGVDKNSAGLGMDRTTYDIQGLPVLYETGVFRNDLYSYTFSMEKEN